MASLPASLSAAHARTSTDPTSRGPRRGSVRYGRCGRTYYAIGDFTSTLTDPDGRTHYGYQDQPERFRHKRGLPWRDLGDTGGAVCGFAAPIELARKWGFQCDPVTTRWAAGLSFIASVVGVGLYATTTCYEAPQGAANSTAGSLI